MTKEVAVERLNTIVANSTTYSYCEFEIQANEWNNYGKSRTYLKIVEKSVDTSVSKHYKVKDYGYIDNITEEYFPSKYGDVRKNYTFSGVEFK